ncbi:MAG: SEL1-like repeat protein [Clostridia bacterium]|nr:SEL1-like repeat protein [Clostridia bacterium]
MKSGTEKAKELWEQVLALQSNLSDDTDCKEVISLLKEARSQVDQDALLCADIEHALGFALLYADLRVGVNAEEISLAHSLLKKCADGKTEKAPVAASHLGVMYTEGRGCKKNFDLAFYYFQKAHDAGYDCSEQLRRFRKKFFGGYTLR